MIHPSKTWQSRTWPFQRWQELTEKLLEKGVSVIAVGKSDPVIQRRLELENISMSPCPKGAINLIDQLSLLETVALLHQCNTLITFDSGLLHLGLSSPIKIVGMFSVVHPKFRLAWRKDGFTHNFISVDPKGDCTYCANGNDMGLTEFSTCPKAEFPPCLPGVDEVMEAYLKIQTRTFKTNDSVLEKGLKK